MKTFGIIMLAMTCHAFPFITRKWVVGDNRDDTVDRMTVDNGNIFLARNRQMQWFRPQLDHPIEHLSRDFPRTIYNLSVKKKALLVSMSPSTPQHVSESMVFVRGKCYKILWGDNTMYETVMEENGYVLRANYFGNITYGNYKTGLNTYNTRTYTNCTYSTMFVYDNYLWCATECEINNTRTTKIDVFDLFVKRGGVDYMAAVPDMSFLIENNMCFHPCQLWVSIDPIYKLVYIIVGYMKGGVRVAQSSYPPEKKPIWVKSSHLPNEHIIRSMSFDKSYLFFLDEEGISAYRLFPRVDIHSYLGKYTFVEKYYQGITQIVSIQKRVFWNGESSVYSAEVVDDS